MRCLVMVRSTCESESASGALPGAAQLSRISRFNEELARAGVMLAGEGLTPSREGKRVRMCGDRRDIVDGPFAETKELIAGFWLWQVRSMEEAMEWARRCPPPFEGECEIEIRPLYEADVFAPSHPLKPHDDATPRD